MSKTKCYYCKATVKPGAVRDIYRVFCDKKCADEHFFMIGLHTVAIGILFVGLVLAWLLK